MRPLSIAKQVTNRDGESLKRYLVDVSRIPMITEDEEVELAILIRNGDNLALEKLVNSNLRFVISVAKQYQGRGLKLLDLINEGNLGLVRAATRFDETRGFKFISYAVWWIRQGILQALTETTRMVRLPLNKISVINKITKASSNFEQIHQRLPYAEEISELIDVSLAEVQLCMKHSMWPKSMDETLNTESDNFTLYEVLSSGNLDNPEKGLIENSLRTELEGLLNILSDREAYVIKKYYGIGANKAMGMEEIAYQLGITKERIRQIKTRALLRLRKSSKCDFLKEYLE
ncbi:RNA polymerase sigma factor RpoD/SigA [Maribacter algicola]|uniref:RNA polymerase sigma factor RpoD/SigA n=1 Tax=Meishania litoralis TaxID=3434685 RepID=A0ACC7LN54_9FLAO